MDIGTKTRCFRQSKRHDLLTGQWEQKRYKQHRDRISNAAAAIDVTTPVSDSFQHVKVLFLDHLHRTVHVYIHIRWMNEYLFVP